MSTVTRAPEDTSDKPPMPAHDYAKQWASDTLSGMADGHRLPWGERNLARSYLALSATQSAAPEMLDALRKCEDVLRTYELNTPNGEEITEETRTIILAAIAKATGATP